MLTRRFIDWPAAGWRNPLAELEQMRRDMSRLTSALFGKPESRIASSGVFPALNVTQDRNNYYVRAELPGIQSQDLDLQVTGRNLTITGERKIESGAENVKYHRKEREAGKFSRVIGLPGEIDNNKVTAQLVNGMLTITIAKAEAAKPKQIAVN
jgi:HSP20 family protein